VISSPAGHQPTDRYPLPDIAAILVFACNLLGDSVCRLPAIRAAKDTYPRSRVCVVADPRYREVFIDQPFVDEVWLLARSGGPLAQGRAWASLLIAARRHRPDLALDLYGSKRTALLSRLSGARWRLGLYREGASRWYNLSPVLREPVSQQGHLIQRINRFVAPAGITAPLAYCPLAVNEADRAAAEAVLAARGVGARDQLVVFNPAARVAAKRWPPERFGALARRLRTQVRVACLVITGPDAPSLTETVVVTSQGAAAALPPLPLKHLAAILARASVLVTGDTGVFHVGMAMGAPAVVLAGPTDADLVALPDCSQVVLSHRDACSEWTTGTECPRGNTCRDGRCLRAITVEEALAGVVDLLPA
jgi:ADP-heptose:LPS heptosyltransferase